MAHGDQPHRVPGGRPRAGDALLARSPAGSSRPSGHADYWVFRFAEGFGAHRQARREPAR
jgi:hypothetical protein